MNRAVLPQVFAGGATIRAPLSFGLARGETPPEAGPSHRYRGGRCIAKKTDFRSHNACNFPAST